MEALCQKEAKHTIIVLNSWRDSSLSRLRFQNHQWKTTWQKISRPFIWALSKFVVLMFVPIWKYSWLQESPGEIGSITEQLQYSLMDSGVNASSSQFRNLNTWKNKMIPQVKNVSDSVKHACVHKKIFFSLRFCTFDFKLHVHISSTDPQ